MVGSWLPEPPRGVDESFHLGGVQVIVESDESDDDGFDHMGYVLLSTDTNQGLANENGDSVDNLSDDNGSIGETPLQEETPSISEMTEQSSSSAEAASSSRSDIEVDCDEVRAAMSNVTLPPSAFPSWASEVPEAHWTSFLMARINNLQADSGIK